MIKQISESFYSHIQFNQWTQSLFIERNMQCPDKDFWHENELPETVRVPWS